jgi:hydrogenase maturation protease
LIAMSRKTNSLKIIILGIGNLLLSDEGLGVHFVQMLDKNDLGYPNLEIIDGGICAEFTSYIEDGCKLIVVDAIKGGRIPGTVYYLNIDDVIAQSASPPSHEMGIIDSLKILKSIGIEPKETIIIGIEPKNLEPGLELSPEVAVKFRELNQLVVEEINKAKLPMIPV